MTPEQFSRRLIHWHTRHGRRDLPWQIRRTPYRVWVSEIMLQQTRVSTVIPYYRRFMERFPDSGALAYASVDEVLYLWTGLGYYARARNLHRSAQILQERHGGEFPRDIDELRSLPGIGRSTAGAILALAYGQRHAILDGNVRRVLARCHVVDGWPGETAVARRLWVLAERHTPEQRVARYTQAIMDLGATICTRTRPQCEVCPLRRDCRARATDRTTDYPAPRPRRILPVRTTNLIMMYSPGNGVLLERRPASGIWGGLWSFPELHSSGDDRNIRDWCREHYACAARHIERWPQFRHTFTHFHLDITPVHVHIGGMETAIMDPGNVVWYNTQRLNSRGLAAPVRRLLNRLSDSTG